MTRIAKCTQTTPTHYHWPVDQRPRQVPCGLDWVKIQFMSRELLGGRGFGIRRRFQSREVGRLYGRSRARCRAVLHAEGEDEDDPPLVDISTKGYGLLLGWCLGRGAGLLDGLHGQVSLVGFLSFFQFFIFCFQFCFWIQFWIQICLQVFDNLNFIRTK
jgi:hypothetical protein